MSDTHGLEQKAASRRFFSRLKSQQTLKWIEVILAVLGSLVMGILFSIFARGGPNSSDINLYMNVGMNGIKMPFILNRYFHVFLQAIFVKMSASPLQGYHLFWGFIIGLNTCLIYLAARKTLKRSNPIHGVLAVLIFYSFAAIAETAGVIVVDFTAMTMITAFFFVYLHSLNQGHQNPWLVGALGFLLYLAFKTKETTLPAAVILVGLGWVDSERFKIRNLLRNAVWVLGGVLGGVVFFGALSWIFLGDPFFGLRISEWREFLNTYAVYSSRVLETMNALADGNLDDWYKGYWFSFAFLPFLLYIISGVKLDREVAHARKVLWLVPLTYTLFLILSINNRLGYEIRFGLPVLPIIAVLAPQFIDIPWPQTKGNRVRYLLYFGMGLAISIGLRFFLRLVILNQGLDLGSVILLMYYPILLTVLFTSLFLFKEKLIWQVVNALILFSLMVSPVASNFRSMFVFRENQATFNEVVVPFVEFKDEIDFNQSTRLYVTYGVFAAPELKIVKNVDELVALVNVYFDASTTRQNFTFQEDPADISGDLLRESYDYALITMGDWIAMQSPEVRLNRVKAGYEVLFGSGGDFVLLRGK